MAKGFRLAQKTGRELTDKKKRLQSWWEEDILLKLNNFTRLASTR